MVGLRAAPFAMTDAVFSSFKNLRPPEMVAFFLSVAVLFLATQYEMPFKVSISTFHVRVMAITPAIASHKVRHPSPVLNRKPTLCANPIALAPTASNCPRR